MALGPNIILGFNDPARTVRTDIDDEGGTDDPDDLLAVDVLGSVSAVSRHDVLVLVGEQGQRQGLLGDEFLELGNRVGRDAQYLVAGALEVVQMCRDLDGMSVF